MWNPHESWQTMHGSNKQAIISTQSHKFIGTWYTTLLNLRFTMGTDNHSGTLFAAILYSTETEIISSVQKFHKYDIR